MAKKKKPLQGFFTYEKTESAEDGKAAEAIIKAVKMALNK